MFKKAFIVFNIMGRLFSWVCSILLAAVLIDALFPPLLPYVLYLYLARIVIGQIAGWSNDIDACARNVIKRHERGEWSVLRGLLGAFVLGVCEVAWWPSALPYRLLVEGDWSPVGNFFRRIAATLKQVFSRQTALESTGPGANSDPQNAPSRQEQRESQAPQQSERLHRRLGVNPERTLEHASNSEESASRFPEGEGRAKSAQLAGTAEPDTGGGETVLNEQAGLLSSVPTV